jgi:hypothetical protein
MSGRVPGVIAGVTTDNYRYSVNNQIGVTESARQPVAELPDLHRPDRLQRFGQMMADGGFSTDAVAVIDTSRRTGLLVLSRPTGQ